MGLRTSLNHDPSAEALGYCHSTSPRSITHFYRRWCAELEHEQLSFAHSVGWMLLFIGRGELEKYMEHSNESRKSPSGNGVSFENSIVQRGFLYKFLNRLV